MKDRTIIAAGVALVAVAASLGVQAGPARSWEDKPCGATEQTAHLCAPGEKARDGSVPNPLPEPAPTPTPPEVVPAVVTPPSTTPAVPVIPPRVPLTCPELRARVETNHAGARWVILLHQRCGTPPPPKVVPTCDDLADEGAGILWLIRFRCDLTPGSPRRFNPPVTGELRR